MAGEGISVIELENVRFGWKAESEILNIPSLSIKPGEKVFVRGASGSGKTTLLGLLGGILKPTAGRISVLGSDIGSFSPVQQDRFRADHIGFIFQMFNLIPYLSVIENVTLPLKFFRKALQKG